MLEFQMLRPSLLSLGGVSISSERSNLGNLYEKKEKGKLDTQNCNFKVSSVPRPVADAA